MYVATLDMLFCSSYDDSSVFTNFYILCIFQTRKNVVCSSYDEVIIVVYTQISNYSAFVFCHIPVNKRQLFSMLPRLY